MESIHFMIPFDFLKVNDVLEIPAHNEVDSGDCRDRDLEGIPLGGGADHAGFQVSVPQV